jgi:hypothetical protein
VGIGLVYDVLRCRAAAKGIFVDDMHAVAMVIPFVDDVHAVVMGDSPVRLRQLSPAGGAKRGPNAVASWPSGIGHNVDERWFDVRVFSHAAPAARKA